MIPRYDARQNDGNDHSAGYGNAVGRSQCARFPEG